MKSFYCLILQMWVISVQRLYIHRLTRNPDRSRRHAIGHAYGCYIRLLQFSWLCLRKAFRSRCFPWPSITPSLPGQSTIATRTINTQVGIHASGPDADLFGSGLKEAETRPQHIRQYNLHVLHTVAYLEFAFLTVAPGRTEDTRMSRSE